MVKKKICFVFDTEGGNIKEEFMLSDEEAKELARGLSEITERVKTWGELIDAAVKRWDGKMAGAALATIYLNVLPPQGVISHE